MSTTLKHAPPRPGETRGDWRTEIPEERRRHLRAWLLTGAVMTFLIVVIGGATRLTQSGLSIVDWNPIMGVIPPLNEAQWWEAFERYQQFPEYQKLRRGMTLPEFQFIFFWEYSHRLFARMIGLVFLIPFLLFLRRGYFNRPLLKRLLVLFLLGGAQGFMGWFMVKSGLVDDPRVSHFRLASHLSFALAILGYSLWLARELAVRPARERGERRAGSGIVVGLGGLLLAQILWGAFVAGLDAGYVFNTFPKMGGGWLPATAFQMEPALRNLVENPGTVQWVHRVLGTILALAALAALVRSRRDGVDPRGRLFAALFASLVLVQYGLGIVTLLLHVPVGLGVAHQGVAVVIFGVWLLWLHHALNRPAA